MSDNKPMISDEAVEAAAKAYHRALRQRKTGPNALLEALDAAAPYLKAEAWDEGWEAGSDDETDSYWGPRSVTTPNPYRSQA